MNRPSPLLVSRISTSSALALAALIGPAAFAQEPPAAPAPPSAPSERPRPAPLPARAEPEPLLSVAFAGGTVAEFVEAVKAASSVPVNVVGPTEAMKAAVPAFSLKNVTALMALKSLEYVNNLQGDGFGGPQSYLRVVDLSQREATGGKSLMYAVSVTRNFVPPSAMASSPFKAADGGVSTQVYAVRDLLGPQGAGAPPGLTIEQIVGPLEAALNVDAEDGSAEPAKLMVHKDSNLILVRGTARQNGLVRQVLDRLREDTMALRAATGREREQARIADELQKQHQVRQRMLEAQIAEQEQHARELNAQIEKARADKRDDQALALTSALNESQAALATLRRQIAQNQLESAQVPFEASRQARITAGATGAQEIAQLRSELEAIRKELNELRAFRPGSK